MYCASTHGIIIFCLLKTECACILQSFCQFWALIIFLLNTDWLLNCDGNNIDTLMIILIIKGKLIIIIITILLLVVVVVVILLLLFTIICYHSILLLLLLLLLL